MTQSSSRIQGKFTHYAYEKWLRACRELISDRGFGSKLSHKDVILDANYTTWGKQLESLCSPD